ncbi:MAG TPA: hypothetical protein VD813_08780, partial [Pseudonocardia sp.]|nr:hypothetical protein [Pseudonocardia sp.]
MPAPSRTRSRPGPRTRDALAALGVVASLATAAWLYVTRPGSLVALLPSTDVVEVHADFHTFWYSAVALTQGSDLYDTPAKLTNLNPPVLSVLLAPFAAVGPLTGYRVF